MAQPFVEPCSRGIIAAEPCPRELGRETSPLRRRMVLAACVLASSMVFVDGSALTVALPRLRADFGADLASVQWVLNGYVLRACVSHADWWRTCRRPRKGTHARGRLYPVRHGVGGLRAGSVGGLADCGARCARHCRGDRSACEPRPYRRDLSARRTKRGDRRLGSSIGPDHRRRSRPGRLADRYLRLADGVLDQPAARTCRCRHLAGLRTGRSPRVRVSST